MKKLLLLSALAFGAITASAQSISVTVEGKPVENGATVNSSRVTFETYEQTLPNFGTFHMTTFQLDPEVYASASVAGQYEVTIVNTTTDNLPDMPGLQICWPENCVAVPLGETVVTPAGTLSPTPSFLQIDSSTGQEVDHELLPDQLWPDQDFTISCRVDIKKAGSSVSEFSFNLNMNFDAKAFASVNGIEINDEAPVEYFDLTGRRVLEPAKGQLVIKRQGGKAVKVII